jgi:hypothetical protein
MKELTRTYGDLLQDKRVRSEQNKYEAFSRQRNSVMSRYRKIFQAYTDLQQGLERAKQFYSEMKETVDSLEKNVQSFVENRRSEGGQLLSAIEAAKGSGVDREQARMKELMERMSVNPSPGPTSNSPSFSNDPRGSAHRPPPLQPQTTYGGYNPTASPPVTPHYQNGIRSPANQYQNYPQSANLQGAFRRESYNQASSSQPQQASRDSAYNPSAYGPVSPPAHQQYFSPPPTQTSFGGYGGQQPSTTQYGQPQQPQGGSQGYGGVPAGWQPPPPPPGPPPSQDYSAMQASNYPSGPGGYASDSRRSQQNGNASGGADPWAGLSGWK